MSWTGVFIALEVTKDLLSIAILIMIAIVCGRCSKEIDLMSKRLEILMDMPLKRAREILRGKKSD